MDEKYFLGFNLGFNASASLLSNKRGIVAAISQERLNGQKNTKEVPFDAMVECCKVAGVNKIQSLCFSHYQLLTYAELTKYAGENYVELVRDYRDDQKPLFELFEAALRNHNITIVERELKRYEHHEAHAASAYAVYGLTDRYVTFTSDGFGDGVSSRIIANDGKNGVRTLAEKDLVNSIGLIYQFVTGALGFTMHKHEGKITGLAAYGEPKYMDCFRVLHKANDITNDIDETKLLELQTPEELQIYNGSKDVIQDFDKFCKLKKTVFEMVDAILKQYGDDLMTTKANIAATVQEYAERRAKYMLFKALLDDSLQQAGGKFSLYLAGGLFANVKINQKLCSVAVESGIVNSKDVFVSPPMGDEGTAIGAAWRRMAMTNEVKKVPDVFESAYDEVCSGSAMKFSVDKANNLWDKLASSADGKSEFEFYYFHPETGIDDQVKAIAELLADKKIVCLCNGRMEFGPRALCHRSILYDCTDATTNDWLNKQLGRTEFMPFAPVCLQEDAEELFCKEGRDSVSHRFMTMTVECTEHFAETYPAAAHIDRTARPQILGERDDEFMRRILQEYKKLTGKKVLINTSFNLHNYPIIENADVAVDSWLKSNTHALSINNVLMVRRFGDVIR